MIMCLLFLFILPILEARNPCKNLVGFLGDLKTTPKFYLRFTDLLYQKKSHICIIDIFDNFNFLTTLSPVLYTVGQSATFWNMNMLWPFGQSGQ